jgi:hypothetical protein
VERLVLTLQGRCVDDDMRRRLGTALQTWLTNGAQLVGELVETNSDKITENAIESDRPIVQMHEMLKKGYTLKSRAFMMTFNSSAFTRDTWDRFWTWIQLLSKRIGAAGRAACLEVSLHPSELRTGGQDVFHIHAYLYWSSADGYDRRNTDELVFEEVRPRVDKCIVSNPKLWKLAVRHGMWYVTVMKLGTVIAASNCKDQLPKPQWLTALWDEHKLSHAQFLEYSTQLRSGHGQRKRDVADVQGSERSQAVARRVTSAQNALDAAGARKAFREFPEIIKCQAV